MSPPNGEVTLIGVGLPRTGTSSLKIAFEQLKGGKCYHMTSFIFEGGDYDLKHWTKAFEGKSTKKDWVEFLEVIVGQYLINLYAFSIGDLNLAISLWFTGPRIQHGR